MATAMDFTTPHGSDLIALSDVFCCALCGAQVAMVALLGGDLAYECQSPRCGKTVQADIPEGLAVRDELAIELPARRVRVREVA
jgi:hypothetical protein